MKDFKRVLAAFLGAFFLQSHLNLAAASGVSGRNLGHRVGAGKGEYHKNLPENSISALKAALLGLEGQNEAPRLSLRLG